MLGIAQNEGQVREEKLLVFSDHSVGICLHKSYLPLSSCAVSTLLGSSLLLLVIYNVCCYNWY